MKIEDVRLSFQGTRVRFRVYAPDAAPARRALFVSSPIGDAQNWHELAQMLAEDGCLCVTAELPGFGRAGADEQAKQDNNTRAQILWGVLDEVEKRRGEAQCAWHLVGHGSGCCAVMSMALYQPDSALSRVLLSPVIDRFTPPPLSAILTGRFGMWLTRAWYRAYILNKKRFKKLARRVYGQNMGKERVAQLGRMLSRKGFLPAITHALREGYALPDGCMRVKTPLMLIWGAGDRIFGGQIPARLKSRMPDAETHLVRAAHMCMESHPDMVRDYLRGWFRFAEGREKAVVKPTAAKPRDTR